MRERCFAFIVDWATKRKEQKQKVDGYHSYKKEQIMENVLETLVIHARYSRHRKN